MAMKMWRGLPLIDDSTSNDDLFNFMDPTGNKVGRGCVPRDYVQQPVGAVGQPPSEMELIPESDWSEWCKVQEETRSTLEHIYLSGSGGTPRFVNLDQNGHGYCATADTEVLTEKGFVPYPEYNWTDLLATVNPMTHALEFQAPFQRHVYEYDGPMIYSTNRRVDFGVTPDHQMYVRKWDEKRRTLAPNYSFVRAADMGWYCGLLHAPSGQAGIEMIELEVPGDRRYDGDDFLALLALVIADGYAGGSENTRDWVSFSSFREESRGAVAALAARIGFHESPSRPGVWVRYDAGALAAWVRANCYVSGGLGSHNKRAPDLVKCASMRQIKHFLQFFNDRNRSGSQYYSSSKRLIDDLQEIHLRIGKRSAVDTVSPRTAQFAGKEIHSRGGYVLTVGEKDRLCLDRKKHIETERYKGLVYCAAVPNHTLITRRNGTTLISSNCWAYSIGHCLMMSRLRDNQPIVRLNPHSVAAIIKRGADEGGWCGLSAEFVRKYGMAPEGSGPGEWPLHSRNTSLDNAAMRTSMARFAATEDWIEMTVPAYDRNLTRQQIATCLLLNNPTAVDFDWWGHSVGAIRLVEVERGSFGGIIINSWNGWGRHGLGVIQGSRWNPMGAVSIRTTKALARPAPN